MKRKFKLIQAGKDILYSLKIGKGKLAKFLAALRDYGIEVRYLMNGMSNTQFVVACVVSVDEIRNKNHLVIKNSYGRLMEMQNLNTSQKYLTVGRITVLMNFRYWHGEARLLDPKGKLLETLVKDISDIEPERKSYSNKEFLKELHDKFRSEHRDLEKSVLVLYSHLIPCTDPMHECAQLIAKYAQTSDNIMIIAYDVTYKDTETKVAIASMSKSKNVYLCHTREIRPYMNKEVYQIRQDCGQHTFTYTSSGQLKLHSEKLHQWYNKGEYGLPTFGRIKRRERHKGMKVASRLFRGRSIRSKQRIKERMNDRNFSDTTFDI